MTSALLDAIASGVRVIDLAQPLYTGMPSSPNHPGFRMVLIRRHGDMVRPDGGSASNELIITGGHVGTHVDALAHVSQAGKLHGGLDAADTQAGGRFSALGIDEMVPLFCRGLLLDVAAAKETDVLDGGYGVTAEDLEHAARAANIQPASGDVVLVRTGWARKFGDEQAYLGHATGVPGITEGGARWLAQAGVVATGTDTTAYEQIPPGGGHSVLPVHGFLLVEQGIHIIEHLDLEALSAARAAEFLFVLTPLRILGGTGSPVRPIAVVPA